MLLNLTQPLLLLSSLQSYLPTSLNSSTVAITSIASSLSSFKSSSSSSSSSSQLQPNTNMVAATATTSLIDVLIIGGGPGGLAVASGLARQLYTAVVFDSGVYRNALATHMHNVVGWDHTPPAEFRRKSRADILARYDTIKFEDVKINSVKKTTTGRFEAVDSLGRTWTGRKLVLATGIKDVFPEIEGYGECWGKGIFHCLFCHGYEERGCTSAGVLAIGDIAIPGVALHLARMALRLAPAVTVYTDGALELTDQITLALKGSVSGIKIDSRPISVLKKGENKAEVSMTFKDGSSITEGFLVHKPKSEVNGPFAQQLGVELTEQGDIKTSAPFHESSVQGVFAIGDCATPMKAVSTAISMGALGAGGLAGQLQMEPF